MSRSFVPSSSQYLEHAAAVVAAAPLTMACWFRTPNVSDNQVLMSVGASGTTHRFGLMTGGAIASDPILAQVNAGSTTSATTTAGYSANVWHHACGVYDSATSRAAYLDGGAKGTNATSKVPSGLNRTAIGREVQATPANYVDGDIAEAAIWNVALTDGEVMTLSLGLSPLLVRPSGLVAYWPMAGRLSPEIDPVGRFDMTITGATQAEHCRIIYPSDPSINSPPSAAPTSTYRPRRSSGVLGSGVF